MRKNVSQFIKVITVFCLLQTFSAQATLLISPTKVTLEDRDRSEQLILINTSDKAVTYRLSWEQKTVSAEGEYKTLTEQEVKTFPIASSMIRFSPKQVKLQAGERQVVKISVRRPKNLKEGEYRSHLKLNAVPDENVESNKSGMSIKANMLFSYVLPVVVRKGEAVSNVSITHVALFNKKAKSGAKILVSLSNNTLYSTNGNLIAYLKDDNGKERIVARLHDFTFYPDLNKTQAQLIWFDDCADGCVGQMRVAFEGINKNTGKTFAEYQMDLNSHSFQ